MVSRSCAELVESCRDAIAKGVYAVGQFVPSAREFSQSFNVSPETARRGLKELEAQGLLVSQPRRGFRVAPRYQSSEETRPVAFATDYLNDMSNAEPASWALNNAIQRIAGLRGWSSLGAHSSGGDRERVLEQVLASGAWGVILDSLDPGYFGVLCRSKLPIVMVNSMLEHVEIDTVVQDNYRGGFLAVRYLLKKDTKRIAWFGAARDFGHTRERHSGAVAGLAAGNITMLTCPCGDATDQELRAAGRKMLRSNNRPDGILAFDPDALRILVEVATEENLVLEKDIRVVGWLVEECYASNYVPVFKGGAVAPAIVWKASSMAEWALHLLETRRCGMRGEAVRLNVPTRLKFE
jgi:DNA-binding LacI/PurR family transcriptional regulator